MNDTALQDILSIQLHNSRIDFRYVIDTASKKVAVEYWVYNPKGEQANGIPIRFWKKRNGEKWEPGIYLNDQFVVESDTICEGITDSIIKRDGFFSNDEHNQHWQSFSLDSSHGRFCFSEQLNGYRVIYKQNIGFLENSDDLMPDEEFIIIKIAEEWLTCKVLGENSREIFSFTHTNEIKSYILQTHEKA